MLSVEKEDLDDLTSLVRHVIHNVAALPGTEKKEEMIRDSRQALMTFHTTASMLGLNELERVGLELEGLLNHSLEPAQSTNLELLPAFASALDTLLEELVNLSNGDNEPSFDSGRVLDVLHSSPSEAQPESSGELTADEFPLDTNDALGDGSNVEEPLASDMLDITSMDFTRLGRIVQSLGGALLVSNNGSGGSFQLNFPMSANSLDTVEALLSPYDPEMQFAPQLSQQDARLGAVLSIIKEFMVAFSVGDMKNSQEILLRLAEQQHQAGLYKEIGSLARDVHDSLRGFMNTMDPALKELVEDRIPDSGSRLEHILRLTENAANTTLDYVEAMQVRNQQEQKKLTVAQEILGGLKAVGDTARGRMTEVNQVISELQTLTEQNSNDLITVLTAQDYQDLTGQIIMKIIDLLKEVELKLVTVIKTFGVRLDGKKQDMNKSDELLYGPAHEGKTEALHSQDDVDSLLAEFGF